MSHATDAYMARVRAVARAVEQAARKTSADPIEETLCAMSPLAWQLAFDRAGVTNAPETMIPDVVTLLRDGGGRGSHGDSIPSDILRPAAGVR